MATVDVWAPVPIGTDQSGETVAITLAGSVLLVEGPERAGRTNTARIAVAAAALDPTVRLVVFDGHGGRDWHPFALVADQWATGATDDAAEDLATVLTGAVADVIGRAHSMQRPDGDGPSGRLTPGLSAADRSLGPVVVAVNEIDRYLAHPAHGPEITRRLVELARLGSPVGYSLILTTTGARQALPLAVRDAADTRVSLHPAGPATVATAHPLQAPRSVVVRAHRLDTATLTWLVERARYARHRATGGDRR
jgi:S-DNA-T family DNA segregation ATPase FtsK/SpoIIIE